MLVLAGHCDVPAYVISRLNKKPLQNYQRALAPERRKPVHNYERALAREARNARTELTGSRLPVSFPLNITSSINHMFSYGVSSLYVRPAVLVCYDFHTFGHGAKRSRSRSGPTHSETYKGYYLHYD